MRTAKYAQIAVGIALLTSIGISSVEAADQGIEGLWRGRLEVPQGEKPDIVFRVGRNADGVLCAYIESADQTKRAIVDEVTCEGNKVRLELRGIRTVYEGTLDEQGTTIEGKWNQAGMSLGLSPVRISESPRQNRPQEANGPCPYDAEEIVFENRSGGVKLAGTLTRPQGEGPFPAVLLLHGSGPNGRDHIAAGHKVFLVLADYLTRRGIAVLRFDKRGVWQSTGDFGKATGEDFADDALAGVQYLKSRSDMNPRQIGLVGISEGGIVGPMVAARSDDVASLVMMAGPGIRLDETLTLQKIRYAEAEGADEEKLAMIRRWYPVYYGAGRTEKDDAKLTETIRAGYEQLSDREKELLGWSPEKLEGKIQELLSPWWRWSLAYDPASTLSKVRCPVLAVNGEKDRQVTARENLPGVEAALRAGRNRDYTVKELPGLNHLFQTAETGAESEYAQIPETMSPVALAMIADWITAHTRK